MYVLNSTCFTVDIKIMRKYTTCFLSIGIGERASLEKTSIAVIFQYILIVAAFVLWSVWCWQTCVSIGKVLTSNFHLYGSCQKKNSSNLAFEIAEH